MTIIEAIARSRKDVGVSSDDTTIGLRYTYAILKAVRSEMIRQEIEKKGLWQGFPLQILRSFPMERIDMSEQRDFKTGIMGFRSVVAFPELMDTKDGKIFGGIFLPNMVRVNMTSFSQWIINKGRRYKYNIVSAYLRDRHLYLVDYPIDTPHLMINADGVYEDPEEVERLNQTGCEPKEGSCVYYPDLEFYLPQYLQGRFFRIVRQELAATLGIPLDNTNNGRSDVLMPPAQNQRHYEQNPG